MNFCTLEQGSKSLGTNKFTLRLAIEWGDNQQKELCYPDNIKQYPGVGIGTLTSNASITQKQCTRHNGSFITHTLASPFLQQTATFLASSHTMQRGHAPCTALWVSERGSTCSWCWRTVFAACGTLLPMQIRLHAHSSASGSMLWAGSSLSSITSQVCHQVSSRILKRSSAKHLVWTVLIIITSSLGISWVAW